MKFKTISKWSLCLLFIIASFFLVKGEKVYAENVYYQPQRGYELDLVVADFTANKYKIGEITISELKDYTGGLVQFSAKDTGNTCGTSPWFYIQIGEGINGAYSSNIDLTNSFQNFSLDLTNIGTNNAGTYNVYATVSCNFGGDHILIKTDILENFWGLISDSGGISEVLIPEETIFTYLNPADGETVATSTSNTFYADLFLAEEDYVADSYIRFSYIRQQNLQTAVANTSLLWTTLELNDVITSGYTSVSTTTGNLGEVGVYYFKAELLKPSSWWSTALSWFNPFTNLNPNIITSTSTTFIYGEMTSFDQFVASSSNAINGFIASSTTSYQNVKNYCSLSTAFEFTDCLSALFVPSNADITGAITIFKDNIGVKFPLGYFNDFITIISTSTIGNLTVLDAELPQGLGLGNPHIVLDLTNKLDFVLNATTSQFANTSSSSTDDQTFFEITNYYWKIVVYILTFFYILSRIIGSQLIPKNNIKTK